MKVKYKMQMHNGVRTMEQQLFLLAERAQRVVDQHCKSMYDEENPPTAEQIRSTMAVLRRQLSETDIFMSGYHAGVQAVENEHK